MSGPSVPWFESDAFEAALARVGDDAEARAFLTTLHERGGASLDLGEAGRALCDQAVRETDPWFADGRVARVQDGWRRSPAVRALALWPRLHELLFAAYGRRSFPFQTINFHEGSEQALHADTMHFSSLPERFMCGVWIALEDVEADAGPLVYHPGSHRLPILTLRDVGVNRPSGGLEDYDRHYLPRLAAEVAGAGLPATTLTARKGTAFVWAANLAHGGAAITRPGSTRRSLVVHCYFEDGLYFTPMYSDPEAGRLHVRLPPDIRTGGFRWPRRDGRRVRAPLRDVAAALARRALNRPRRILKP